MHLIGAVFRLQISSNFLYEIWRQRVGVVLQMKNQRQRARVGGLSRGYFSVFQHCVDHKVAALQCAVGMVDRRIYSRAFGQTGEQSSFFQTELSSWLVEVELRCGLETIDAMA